MLLRANPKKFRPLSRVASERLVLRRRVRSKPTAAVNFGPFDGAHSTIAKRRLSHRMGKAEPRYSIEPFASLRAKIAAWLARRRGLFTGKRASIKVSTGFDQRTRSQ